METSITTPYSKFRELEEMASFNKKGWIKKTVYLPLGTEHTQVQYVAPQDFQAEIEMVEEKYKKRIYFLETNQRDLQDRISKIVEIKNSKSDYIKNIESLKRTIKIQHIIYPIIIGSLIAALFLF
jgi:hypothetical protein